MGMCLVFSEAVSEAGLTSCIAVFGSVTTVPVLAAADAVLRAGASVTFGRSACSTFVSEMLKREGKGGLAEDLHSPLGEILSSS